MSRTRLLISLASLAALATASPLLPNDVTAANSSQWAEVFRGGLGYCSLPGNPCSLAQQAADAVKRALDIPAPPVPFSDDNMHLACVYFNVTDAMCQDFGEAFIDLADAAMDASDAIDDRETEAAKRAATRREEPVSEAENFCKSSTGLCDAKRDTLVDDALNHWLWLFQGTSPYRSHVWPPLFCQILPGDHCFRKRKGFRPAAGGGGFGHPHVPTEGRNKTMTILCHSPKIWAAMPICKEFVPVKPRSVPLAPTTLTKRFNDLGRPDATPTLHTSRPPVVTAVQAAGPNSGNEHRDTLASLCKKYPFKFAYAVICDHFAFPSTYPQPGQPGYHRRTFTSRDSLLTKHACVKEGGACHAIFKARDALAKVKRDGALLVDASQAAQLQACQEHEFCSPAAKLHARAAYVRDPWALRAEEDCFGANGTCTLAHRALAGIETALDNALAYIEGIRG